MVAQTAEPLTRPNHYRDMPAGLEPRDALAYRVGYGRGCLTYTRKHGAPVAVHDGPAPAAGTAARKMLGRELTAGMRVFELERHPAAHRAGMSALTKARKARGLDAVADPTKAPAGKAPRKVPARKLAAVPDVAPAPVDETPAPKARKAPARKPRKAIGEIVVIPVTAAPVSVTLAPVPDAASVSVEPATAPWNTRRAARRALAAAMRERGENPSDLAAWNAAKLTAGVQ